MSETPDRAALKTALEQMMKRRSQFATALAGPYKSGDTELLMSNLVQTQSAIKVIRTMLKDQRAKGGQRAQRRNRGQKAV